MSEHLFSLQQELMIAEITEPQLQTHSSLDLHGGEEQGREKEIQPPAEIKIGIK